jgi:hypothetical protein
VSSYQLLYLDSLGKVRATETIEFDVDSDVQAYVKKWLSLTNHASIEGWQGNRRVHRLGNHLWAGD